MSFAHVLFFCFFCGAAAGTAGANLLGKEILSGGAADAIHKASCVGAVLDWGEKKLLWRYVFRQRMKEFGLAVLVGLTPFSALGFAAAAFAGGLGGGFMLSIATLQNGVSGLFLFLLAMLPQWLFYLPVWMILAVKAEDGLEQMKFRYWPILLAAVLTGIFLEAYINPWLWRF